MTDSATASADVLPIPGDRFRRALGQFPTGVTVVTAARDGQLVGMTANSFASVSLDPPLILWSVAKSAHSHDAYVAAKAFAVHFLGADHQQMALRFASRGSKFEGLPHAPGITGAPLIDGIAPIFECRIWARYPGGDHTILVGEVVRLIENVQEPLLFHSGQMRRIESPPPRRALKLADNSFARNYLAYLLARASHMVSNAFHASLPQWNITVEEWRVLACLMDVDGLSVSELAEMALANEPRLAQVLEQMEGDGLIERRGAGGDPDHATIHLTPEGRARVLPVQQAAKAHEAELLRGLSEDERATIKFALDLLIGQQAPPEADQ